MEAAKFRRQTGAAPADAPVERHPIVVDQVALRSSTGKG